MKKYVKPLMECESFISNEYVAACWIVNCNVSYGNIYNETNGVEGLQVTGNNADELIGAGVLGCGTKHIGVTETPVENGYQVGMTLGGAKTTTTFNWKDEHGWHSTYFDEDNWTTNSNAS